MEKHNFEFFVKDFCEQNSKIVNIDFSIFKNSLKTIKGELFEMLLAELFRGNGYLADRIGEGGHDGGCDLLIKYPKDNSIKFVLQAKNWNESISINDIEAAQKKFERNYKKQYNLSNNNFCLVAWKYVKGIKVKIISETNINVWDEQEIIYNLFANYKSKHPEYPTIQLKNHQQSAYENILRFWRNGERCYVEHATGTGKTYIIAKIVENLILNDKNRILIISPSSFINERIISLINTIIPIEQIAKNPNPDKVITILTYQYLYRNAKAIPSGLYSHVIMDEAHRAGAPLWNKQGILPLLDKKTKVAGLSATMERHSSGLDVKTFMGNNCAGKLSLFRAITQGILPTIGKYVYSVQDLTPKIKEVKLEINSKYQKFPEERAKVSSFLDVTQVKDYSIQNIIYKHYASLEYQKIIAFCEGVEHVNNIRKLLDNTFLKFSNVDIERVTSRQSKKKNKSILDDFSNCSLSLKQTKIVLAIDMLNEGIDVKGIDSIMLFRKTESPRVYLQQIGRVLRNNGKENPLIFDCVLNYQNVKINLVEESEKEVIRYKKTLADLGFKDVEIPKTLTIHDEIKNIHEIIKKVEVKLNFYRSYEDAKEATKRLGINTENEYRRGFKANPRLPSKPYVTYKNKGWIDWPNFFGRETTEFYSYYLEAKLATQKLNIKTFIEYRKKYKEDAKLPSQPDRTYHKKGWVSWSDYFGTTDTTIYESYEEAKLAARALLIKSYTEYKERHAEDQRLPSSPQRKYNKNGWNGFPEFLGVDKVELYQTIEEAINAVAKLKIKTEKEYRIRYKEDKRLPNSPAKFYENKGWVSNYHFFGKPIPKAYSAYSDAKQAAKKLSLKSRKDYELKYALDEMLPSNPMDKYKDTGWVDYYEFLDIPRPDFYQSYKEAKSAASRIGIKSRKEYVDQKRYQDDPKLPSQPHSFYKGKGWTNWNDFIEVVYNTYEEAEKAVRRLGIKTRVEYMAKKRYKEDVLLPSNPEKRYKEKGWISWYIFLGTKAPVLYSYYEAEKAVRRLNILSMKEYKERRHEDAKLPSSPSECYKNKGWINSNIFLNIQKQSPYITYRDAQKAVQKLGIKNRRHYHDKKLYKKDPKLPSTPDILYKHKGWVDWPSFLGNEPTDIYPTYEEARQAAQKLDIKTGEAYRKQHLYKLDPRLPSTPEMKYKDAGWINYYHFLGLESRDKYTSYEDARKAAHKLNIKSIAEYHQKKRYLEDKKLTSNPNRKFKKKGWISWKDFLGL